MSLRNTRDSYGSVAKFFHWTTASAFVGAYIAVYYVIWFMDDTLPESLPILNIHWAFGIIVGALVLPRLIWKVLNVTPVSVDGTVIEHRLARLAHLSLYLLMLVMPLTGYLGTAAPTYYGMFSVPGFNDSAAFAWVRTTWGLTWKEFEAPIDVVHHFLGKWVAWSILALHIIAAFYHHLFRRDAVLVRMLPFGKLSKIN